MQIIYISTIITNQKIPTSKHYWPCSTVCVITFIKSLLSSASINYIHMNQNIVHHNWPSIIITHHMTKTSAPNHLPRRGAPQQSTHPHGNHRSQWPSEDQQAVAATAMVLGRQGRRRKFTQLQLSTVNDGQWWWTIVWSIVTESTGKWCPNSIADSPPGESLLGVE